MRLYVGHINIITFDKGALKLEKGHEGPLDSELNKPAEQYHRLWERWRLAAD